MPAWYRDSKGQLVSFVSIIPLDSIIPIMTDPISTLVILDRCYPSRSSTLSCIILPAASENNYEFKSQFISMLSKFTGSDSEDACMFISEFEKYVS